MNRAVDQSELLMFNSTDGTFSYFCDLNEVLLDSAGTSVRDGLPAGREKCISDVRMG